MQCLNQKSASQPQKKIHSLSEYVGNDLKCFRRFPSIVEPGTQKTATTAEKHSGDHVNEEICPKLFNPATPTATVEILNRHKVVKQ